MPVVEVVSRSRHEIDRAMDSLSGLQSDGVVVTAAYPDPAQDRLVVEVDRLPVSFARRVVATYGAALVAVRQVPAGAGRAAQSFGDPLLGNGRRDREGPPLAGGAADGSCTDGFAWFDDTGRPAILTAGHCGREAHLAGGTVAPGEDSWRSGTGTVLMTGETTYRGDQALVRVDAAAGVQARVFREGPTATRTAPVTGRLQTAPHPGEVLCTGGSQTGEQCGWVVVWAAAGNYTYDSGEIARRVWRADRSGPCLLPGDSGGPVYTLDEHGGVVARGILSGATGFGGSDHTAAPDEQPCRAVFTDIADVWLSMPGDLATTPAQWTCAPFWQQSTGALLCPGRFPDDDA